MGERTTLVLLVFDDRASAQEALDYVRKRFGHETIWGAAIHERADLIHEAVDEFTRDPRRQPPEKREPGTGESQAH